MGVHIQFFGAAGEVTGSRQLLSFVSAARPRRFLVDCGMFQGGHESLSKNAEPFGFDPADIDFLVLTHAHIDHSGLIPRLCQQGFKGPIYCTPSTLELLKILLPDSAHIQSSDYERVLRRKAKGKYRGEVYNPLYTLRDVDQALLQVRAIAYGTRFAPCEGAQMQFENAGHILGSAILVASLKDDAHEQPLRLVFSGDLGMQHSPIMPNPTLIEEADALIVESTYGDRLHRSMESTEDEIVSVVRQTLEGGGNLVVPSFAVGRTQEMLFLFVDLVRRGRLPTLDVWVDSPMATAATSLTHKLLAELGERARETSAWFAQNPQALNIRFVSDVEESKALNRIKGGAIIISASGMCEAGRILHHLYWNLPKEHSAVLITGFQAQGTLGRRLVDGQSKVRLLGEEVLVRASIHTIGGLSAHADQEGLLTWCRGFRLPPARTFIVHGEQKASEVFREAITHALGWPELVLPGRGVSYTLHPSSAS
ncbi:MAG: MBL fold metallo-hydrolase [Betaproteobacteria bacterium]|nr:MBL fold metallo-hydrolase [Betaproteobacteria bacterium]NBT75551.1 MBL fold metallo-hydrolase [Betaproteobacteria bacterium]NCA15435.1 MBL fold metallo-hydrolase [Betaproteobacteria bacterium]